MVRKSILGLCLLGAATVGAQTIDFNGLESVVVGAIEETELRHSEIKWQELSEGLYFSKVDIYRGEKKVESMATVKIEPDKNEFRVVHSYQERNIDAWQKKMKAPVVFNAGFFEYDNSPTGLIICNGTPRGRNNPRMRGMFVAEPKKEGYAQADILNLRKTKISKKYFPWKQGVQSYPLLLDEEGRVGVRKSGLKADRTVIAKDYSDNILVFSTEKGYFTLNGMGYFLKDSGFDVRTALNLDGGLATALSVRTDKFKYVNYGDEEIHPTRGTISRPGKVKIGLPAVIGVYSKY